ncbi:MAG: neutral zinc metallopeptidase [Candidatus Acidiferrales bacterium]
MRWTPGGTSGDIEDRRNDSGSGGFGGGGFGGIHIGIGGLLVLLVLSFIFKRDLISPLLNSGAGTTSSGPSVTRPADPAREAAEQKEVQFVSFVLDDAQDTWTKMINGYRHAKLVLFRDSIQSACGGAQTASGPFYCPADEKVYLDLAFFDELSQRFNAAGDFARAYVVAHELGHHVQKLLGTEAKMRAAQQANPSRANDLSVRLELQADCYAGVWGHSTEQRAIIDQSDIQSGLNAAAAVGDDRLQKMATGTVMPERFTHGTSAQRAKWLQAGLDSGRIDACDTFSVSEP